MGLSNVSILQQEEFFSGHAFYYVARRVANQLYFYKPRLTKKQREQIHEASLENLVKEKLTGELKKKSVKHIVNICQNWHDTIEQSNEEITGNKYGYKRQIVMLTLTLSKTQFHDDLIIKRKMLNEFLITLIRYKPTLKYLWKAEAQDNGNIHFHLLVDEFVSKEWYQIEWNNIQIKHGYHDEIKLSDTNLGQPSTRIEGLRNKNNAIAYVAKYLSKNEKKRPIRGRLWGCSDALRNLKPIEYKVTKSDVLRIVETTCESFDQVFINPFCLFISKPINYNLIAPTLHTFDNISSIIKYNTDLLNSVEEIQEYSEDDRKDYLFDLNKLEFSLMEWSTQFWRLQQDFD